MPDETTILSLPLILPAQAQKHVTHNEAIAALDLIVQLTVIDRTRTAAPALPALGDRHIVADGATGDWVGQSGRIALYGATGWQFTQALPGWRAHVLAEGQTAVFDGLAWAAPSDGPLEVTQLGVSATADAVNRLVVSSPAVLLNHAGGGHQLKLNKAAAGDTASLLFQTGFGGRAEMGTAGSDDFSVKVSADGSAWATALAAEAGSGEVTLPQPLHLGGQAADPVAPADGTLWLNTTTGEVKVRSGGATLPLGGGISDGDKGDVSVSGGGAVWTIDAGAVSLGKLADIATDSFLGRDTAGTGSPEVLSPAQARGILNVADGATANASDAALRDRATHTGTQAAATITGLAPVATSGSASDLSAGTLPAARFDDTAHGARAGGTLHAAASGVAAGFMSAADKAKLDAISGTNTGDQTITLTGDVTGSGTGSFAATIANLAVTSAKIADDAVGNDKLANMSVGTIKARVTAGTGNPENATGTQVTALLDTFTSGLKGLAPASGGGTTNFLRADGTWAAPSAGGVSDGDKGDITVSGGGTVWTIDAGAVGLSKLADMASGSILGRATAGTGVPEALTGVQATALLDTFTSGAKGLAPASGGGTANFLRADGTWAAPAGGGGSPGGATGEIQFNNAGAFAGAADVEIEGGQLRLPYVSTPSTPAAGGLKLYGADVGGGTPAFLLPNGKVKLVQSDLGDFNVRRFTPVPSSNSVVLETSISFASSGTVTASGQPGQSNLFDWLPRLEWLVTAASTTAIAGWRPSASARYLRVGRSAGAPGGFLYRQLWGPATGVATATNRCFVGVMDAQSAPTDVEPSTRLNMVGMGWDAADTNIQIMHNDNTGTATKIDLGASFPVPTVDRASVYELQLYSPNSLTQSVSYRVIRYSASDKTIAAEATGTLATDLPVVGAFMGPVGYISVGGTSSVIGIANFGIYTATEN